MRKTVCQLIQYHMAMNFQLDLFIFLQQLWLPQWPYTRCDMLPSLSLTCFAIPASTEAQAKDKLLCRENKWQNPKSKNMDSNPKRKIFIYIYIYLKFFLERKDVPAISIPFPWDGFKTPFPKPKKGALAMTLSERSLPLSDEELKMTGQLVLRAMKHQQLESICSLMGQYGEEGLAFRRLVFFFGITGCNKSDAEWVPRAAWCDLFFWTNLRYLEDIF